MLCLLPRVVTWKLPPSQALPPVGGAAPALCFPTRTFRPAWPPGQGGRVGYVGWRRKKHEVDWDASCPLVSSSDTRGKPEQPSGFTCHRLAVDDASDAGVTMVTVASMVFRELEAAQTSETAAPSLGRAGVQQVTFSCQEVTSCTLRAPSVATFRTLPGALRSDCTSTDTSGFSLPISNHLSHTSYLFIP